MSLLDITKVSEAAKTPVVSLDNPEQMKMSSASQNVTISAETTPSSETTASIVQHLLAQGLSMDAIILPGSAKDAGIYVADDFDAPLPEGFWLGEDA